LTITYKRRRVKFDSLYSFVKCNSSQSFWNNRVSKLQILVDVEI
jgi:hypothetical protein